MYKKTVPYTDYNGNQRTEDLYFNLNKAELTEMEMASEGGMQAKLQKLMDANDNAGVLALFKDLILKSYGIKSEDGRRFIKNAQITEEFTQTEAFSELFMSLASSEEEATKFIQGILPQGLVGSVDQSVIEAQNQKKNIPAPAVR
jgi:hypothetical protein